jgi:hypothetical protein
MKEHHNIVSSARLTLIESADMGRKRCPQESPRSTRTGQTSVDGDEAGMDAMKSVERTGINSELTLRDEKDTELTNVEFDKA